MKTIWLLHTTLTHIDDGLLNETYEAFETYGKALERLHSVTFKQRKEMVEDRVTSVEDKVDYFYYTTSKLKFESSLTEIELK